MTVVLVVDDNPVDREAAQRLLGHRYRCIGAATGAEGIALCRQADPACVLLDYRLPDKDGLAWLPEFLAAQVGVVMLTDAGEPGVVVESLRGGAHDYLAKAELTTSVLERAIRNATEKAALMRELELHRRVVDQMPIGIVVCRLEDENDPGSLRVLSQNPATQVISGVGTEHLGRTVRDMFPMLLETTVPSLCVETVRLGVGRHLPDIQYGDQRVRRSVYEVRTVPLGGRLVAVLFEDVSKRVVALDERRKMEEQMRASQRLEAVGRLAGGVAHDFNNVLTVIQSYAGFLDEQFHPSDPAREDVAAIVDAADRAARLTSQLLAFSRKQMQDLRVVKLNDTVVEVEKLLHRLIGEDVQLVSDLAEDLGTVKSTSPTSSRS